MLYSVQLERPSLYQEHGSVNKKGSEVILAHFCPYFSRHYCKLVGFFCSLRGFKQIPLAGGGLEEA
jgi:hypothetical protein